MLLALLPTKKQPSLEIPKGVGGCLWELVNRVLLAFKQVYLGRGQGAVVARRVAAIVTMYTKIQI